MLMLFKKHLNMLIDNVNQLSQIVENIDDNFTDIYEKINIINSQIENLNKNFEIFERTINQNVQNQLTQFNYEIVALLNDYKIIFDNNIEVLRQDLENQIEDIELGNVIAYNPTTRWL